MTFDIDEVFECTGKKNIACLTLGCVIWSEKQNKLIVCNRFKLKDGYSIYKK